MKTLLITGASGLLGGHLFAQAMSRKRWRVVPHYHQHGVEAMSRNGVCCDLSRRQHVDALLKTVTPDIILHTAAISNLDVCEQEPNRAFVINSDLPCWLALYAGKTGARLIHLSSDMVFDGSKGRYHERDAVSPLSLYGQSKVKSEARILNECRNAVVARSALIYGRPCYGGTSFSMWMEQRLRHNEPVPLYRDQYRSPILVNNLAAALLELVDCDFNGLIHLGGGERCDRYSFGVAFCRILKYDRNLLQATSMFDAHTPARRPRDVSLDVSRAASLLHTELLDVKDGIKRLSGEDCS